jgi:hypothetical protein
MAQHGPWPALARRRWRLEPSRQGDRAGEEERWQELAIGDDSSETEGTGVLVSMSHTDLARKQTRPWWLLVKGDTGGNGGCGGAMRGVPANPGHGGSWWRRLHLHQP